MHHNPYLVHAAHVVQELVFFHVLYRSGSLREKTQHGFHLLLPVLAFGDLHRRGISQGKRGASSLPPELSLHRLRSHG